MQVKKRSMQRFVSERANVWQSKVYSMPGCLESGRISTVTEGDPSLRCNGFSGTVNPAFSTEDRTLANADSADDSASRTIPML